mgnify:CR=1 FL=1
MRHSTAKAMSVSNVPVAEQRRAKHSAAAEKEKKETEGGGVSDDDERDGRNKEGKEGTRETLKYWTRTWRRDPLQPQPRY